MDKNNRIVVSGAAPITGLGCEVEEFWQNILDKNLSLDKERIVIDGESWGDYYLHKLKNFKIQNFGIENKYLNDIEEWKGHSQSIDLYYLLAAAKQALDNSGLTNFGDRDSLGLILAHENPGINCFLKEAFDFSYDFLQKKKFEGTRLDYYKLVFEKFGKSVYDLQTFMFLFHVGKALQLRGKSLFLNNACSSGLYAMESAASMIREGHCRAVVIATADYPDLFKYLWFKKLGIYAEDGLIKPFSDNANGIVFGDGGSGLVMEDLDFALKRGANIYGEYLGGAFSFEGWKVVFPAISQNFYRDTIAKALEITGTSTGSLDLIVPHGVGIKVTDSYEAKALFEIFEKEKNILYSTFKPYVGHNLGGSTLLETIILLLAIKNQTIPATLNYTGNSKLNITFVQKNTTNASLNCVMKTSTAFGGFDSAVILKRFVR